MIHIVQAKCLENARLAERTFRIRLECPAVASAIRPGQFVMLRLGDRNDPLLGRPFALFDTVWDKSGCPIGIDVVYLVVGKMTGVLSSVKVGENLTLWGPLGQSFPELVDVEHAVFVAGGIGQTPFLAYARELLGLRGYGGDVPKRRIERIDLFYGVRTASLFACVEDFQALGVSVHLATDDGSGGFHGRVTELLEKQGPAGPLVGCGPQPMLKTLAHLAEGWNVPCYVSLETPMACGVGICFSCVTKVIASDSTQWDYQRVCVEGPVFNAKQLVWD